MPKTYKVKSDGTVTGTRVTDPEGNVMRGITEMHFSVSGEDSRLQLYIKVHPKLELEIPEDQVTVERGE